MKRHFCDICEAEIVEANNPLNLQPEIRGKSPATNRNVLTVEVITYLNGAEDHGDICKYCIIDAVYAADDRPREEE